MTFKVKNISETIIRLVTPTPKGYTIIPLQRLQFIYLDKITKQMINLSTGRNPSLLITKVENKE